MLGLINLMIYLSAAVSLTYGVYLMFQKKLRSLNEQIAVEKRVRRIVELRKVELLGSIPKNSLISRILKDLDYMLETIHPKYDKQSTLQNFLLFQVITFLILTLFVKLVSGSFSFGLMVGVLFLFWNFARHRINLRRIRLDRGYKLAKLTGVLAAQYNGHQTTDPREAIRRAMEDETVKEFHTHLSEIYRVETNYENAAELKEAFDRFQYSIKTSFAKELASTLYKGLTKKTNIGSTLARIDTKIQQNMKDILKEEEDKIGVRNLSRLHIIAFPSILLGMFLFLRISQYGIIHYQFNTAQGQVGFTISVLSIIGAWILSTWYSKQPNDY